MLAQDARDIIAKRLGRRTDLNDDIIAEMTLAQAQHEGGRFIPWFLEWSTIPALDVAANDPLVPLPSNFLREVECGGHKIFSPGLDSTKVRKTDLDILNATYAESVRGRPCHYALYRSFIQLGPTPDVAYKFVLNYYRRDKVVALNEENLWLQHASDLIIAQTIVNMCPYVSKPELKPLWEAELGKAVDKLWVSHEAHENTNRDYVRGDA